jgi:hypothetical protein
MIVLRSTETLEAILSGLATTAWHYSVYGVEKPTNDLYANKGTDLNNTAVTISAAPAEYRILTEILIKNKNNVAGSVTLRTTGGSTVDLGTWTLAAGQTLLYSREAGFILTPTVAAINYPTVCRNTLVNGSFRVNDRGDSTSVNDDTYSGPTNWNILSDGNTVVDVAQDVSDVPTGAYSCEKLTAHTGITAKKFGIVQILEGRDAKHLVGSTATLSFQAKVSNARLGDIRAVVLSWGSTVDSVTSDVVNSWEAASTNPTWAANWTAENTPANLSVTTSWATYTVPGIAIDTAGTTNVAVFIWNNDVAYNAGDILRITDVQLEKGSVATDFEFVPYSTDLLRCQRYYEKSESGNDALWNGAVTSGELYYNNIYFKATKRAAYSSAAVVLTHSNAALFPNTASDINFASLSMMRTQRTANGTGRGYFADTWSVAIEL